MREDSERDVVAADVFPLALWERVRVREDSERDVGDADVFTLALWERVRVREDSERDTVPDGCPFGHGYKEGSVWNRPLRYFSQPWDVGIANVFPLAFWERVRVREDSERDGVTYGCLFEHGYKEGSVWNRPLQYFSQQRDVGIGVPYKYIKHFSINLRIIGRIEPTNPELLDISDTNPKNPRRFSNTLHLSVSKNPFIMIKSNEK